MELIKYCQQAEVRPSNIGTGIWAKTVAKEVSGTSKAIQISSKISTGLAVAGVALDVGIGIAQNNYTQGNGTAQIGISGTAAFFLALAQSAELHGITRGILEYIPPNLVQPWLVFLFQPVFLLRLLLRLL